MCVKSLKEFKEIIKFWMKRQGNLGILTRNQHKAGNQQSLPHGIMSQKIATTHKS
jgi:hypothetical protein